jgi:hypothetical protein
MIDYHLAHYLVRLKDVSAECAVRVALDHHRTLLAPVDGGLNWREHIR